MKRIISMLFGWLTWPSRSAEIDSVDAIHELNLASGSNYSDPANRYDTAALDAALRKSSRVRPKVRSIRWMLFNGMYLVVAAERGAKVEYAMFDAHHCSRTGGIVSIDPPTISVVWWTADFAAVVEKADHLGLPQRVFARTKPIEYPDPHFEFVMTRRPDLQFILWAEAA